MSWYSATPTGLLESRRAYSATTLFLLLQICCATDLSS
jgi:hypothetical protein